MPNGFCMWLEQVVVQTILSEPVVVLMTLFTPCLYISFHSFLILQIHLPSINIKAIHLPLNNAWEHVWQTYTCERATLQTMAESNSLDTVRVYMWKQLLSFPAKIYENGKRSFDELVRILGRQLIWWYFRHCRQRQITTLELQQGMPKGERAALFLRLFTFVLTS